MPNRLAAETSPYLKQHADNPVDWYPWGPEALERARRQDLPILLSVGYSACHWCHVMERESFADPDTADLMNRAFVNIKVDREERPDVDGIYMRAVQALTGRGGWPMTVFLTPDGTPFYGGTYFPPEPRHGMPAFRQVLGAVAEAWRNRRDEVLRNAGQLTDALARSAREADPGSGAFAGDGVPGAPLVSHAVRHLDSRFDPAHGGFGGAPKFPQPVTLEFLLAAGIWQGEPRAVEMVVHTLRSMAAGGIRDHLGGGFHRYSVDDRWLVPHFEKMLYDNALLARLYLDAYRVTGEEGLRKVCVETLEYILGDLRAPSGGFYAARDADSEGEEGLFYLWTPAEVEDAAAGLDPQAVRLFLRLYDVAPGGNFEGRSILHLPHAPEAVARSAEMSLEALRESVAAVADALRQARASREHPFRDEKVICSWCAFTVRALAEAGAALDRSDFLGAAVAGGGFMAEAMVGDGGLLRIWTDGEAKIPAFLEDWAAAGNAFLSLHEATLDPAWLTRAAWAGDEILRRFRDPDSGLLYDAPAEADELIIRH
ncbi:MAG TPA: thioredoxin domain-containing protein, partial [Longimicrobiales bacterium]|nr:thioredoxin domain-containing protein [Longimicrobiales bacterium]